MSKKQTPLYALMNFQEIAVDPEYENDYVLMYRDTNFSNTNIAPEHLQVYLEAHYPKEMQELLQDHEETLDWHWDEDIERARTYFPHIFLKYVMLKKEAVRFFFTKTVAEQYLREHRQNYHKKAYIEEVLVNE